MVQKTGLHGYKNVKLTAIICKLHRLQYSSGNMLGRQTRCKLVFKLFDEIIVALGSRRTADQCEIKVNLVNSKVKAETH